FLFALGFLVLGLPASSWMLVGGDEFRDRELDTARPVERPVKTPARITTPKDHLGFNLGDDYCLANYKQLRSYWAKLEKESDRLKIINFGVTEEGRPQLMGIVTSPANHKNLARYQAIARRLALSEGVSAEEAAKLADEGKAIVWINGGLHAS